MKLKSLTMALMLMAGWTTLFAQAPTTSAPVPTRNADQVKSAFSDAYSQFLKWSRAHGATMDIVQVGSDNVAKFEGDYIAVNIGDRNVGDMEYFHADVYAPATNGISQIRFGFALWSGGEKYADAYNTDLTPGEWMSVDIPLSAFAGYNFNNVQVLRATMTKTPGNVVYLDNVYFYTTQVEASTVPTVAAPKPTLEASKVRSMFSDAYTPYYNFDGYNNNGIQFTERTIAEGEKVLELKGFRWCHFALGEVAGTTTVDLTDLTDAYLHFDVYVPADNVTKSVQPGMYNVEAKKEAFSGAQPLTGGQWTSVNLKVKDFQNVGLSAVHNLTFKDPANQTGLIYLDNVYFYSGEQLPDGTSDGGGSDPNPGNDDPTPSSGLLSAPTPTNAAADVKSVYSDAYESFCTFDFAGGNAGIAEEEIAITAADKARKLTGYTWVKYALGTVDVSDMTILHFDVYTPADAPCANIQPILVNGNTSQYTGSPELSAGKWTSVNVKLADYVAKGLNASAVNEIRFKHSGTGTLIIDNVYFAKDNGASGNTDAEEPDTPQPSSNLQSAPTPTNAAADVKSVYSDAYTTAAPEFTFDRGNAGIDQGEIAITESDNALKVSNYNYAIYKVGTFDVSDMDYWHLDVYTPAGNENCPKIQPILVNGSTSFYTGDTQLTAGKWTSINIKMADFTAKGLNASAVNEIRFKRNDSSNGTVVIDNIYFSKEAGNSGTSDGDDGDNPGQGNGDNTSGNIPLAPVPTHDAADVKNCFSDTYPVKFGKFEPTSYSNATIEILKVDDNNEVARFTHLDWAAVNIGQRDFSDKGYVHFDLYTPSTDQVKTFNFGFQFWGEPITYETADGDAYWRTLVADQWQSFDIPLTHFVGRDFKNQTAGFRIRKTGGGTLYMDNLYFYGSPQDDDSGYDPDAYPAIQDSSDGVLPPIDQPMLGVNLSSASGGTVPGVFGTNYIYPKKEDLYYFKAKGVRFIRFPFRAARVVEDINNPVLDYDQGTKSDIEAMKAVVAEAERLGMWVFLDAHDYAERTINGTQYLLGEGEYTIEKFAKVWGLIADAFKGYSNIWGYDLQNEPKVTAPVLVEAYQAAINEIRKYDQNAQIIVEATNWASAYEWIYGDRSDKSYPEYTDEVAWSYKQNSPWLLDNLVDSQDKLVFQAHGYFDKDNSGTYTKGFEVVDWKKRFRPFLEWAKTNNKKALMGEFGVPYNEHATGDERYMTELDEALQFFREYQINATYWCAGAMYEGNSLTCQPDKNALYGNYAKEKSTIHVLEKYFQNWVRGENGEWVSGIETTTAPSTTATGIYNLSGQRVDSTYRGLVIENGRKVYRK